MLLPNGSIECRLEAHQGLRMRPLQNRPEQHRSRHPGALAAVAALAGSKILGNNAGYSR
jgi:hypothetical protein